ncbi:MAG: hypothetical protein COC06_01420 [Bacteroidales bacterium]|jgi:uncharacterized protein DUF6686|nr:MAG: hypothetical protein COC06_01420 [Bacteroidales bacterium]
MNNVMNQTENGKIFRCSGCSKIHIEYKNLNFNFDDEEYKNFANYFMELDGPYWENVNIHVHFRKKIIVPVGHKNLNMLLDNSELQELKQLFSKSITHQFNLLSHFNYDIFNN